MQTKYNYNLSLHDTLPILLRAYLERVSIRINASQRNRSSFCQKIGKIGCDRHDTFAERSMKSTPQLDETLHVRSEEHTSELQSRLHLVCCLLLENNNDD